MSSLISIRVNDEEKVLLESVAAMYHSGISSLIKKFVFEKIEDDFDLKIAQDYEERKSKGEVELLSHDEVWDSFNV